MNRLRSGGYKTYCFEQFHEILCRREFAQACNIYLLFVGVSISALFLPFWIRDQDAHWSARLELSTMKFQSILGRRLQCVSFVETYRLEHVPEMCTVYNKTVSCFCTFCSANEHRKSVRTIKPVSKLHHYYHEISPVRKVLSQLHRLLIPGNS